MESIEKEENENGPQARGQLNGRILTLSISADALTEVVMRMEFDTAQPTPFNLSSLLPLCKFNQLKVLEFSWLTIEVEDRTIDLLTSSLVNLVQPEIASVLNSLQPLLTWRGSGTRCSELSQIV